MNETLDLAELKASGKLPSPKGVALWVMHLCQEETVNLPELARAIQADPALAGRIIKIANYVNPTKSRPIASVTADTLILIGIHAVRQAVMCMSVISNYRDGACELFDYEYFWSRAIAMASAAHAISSVNRVAPPAEMFNCGLMSGIGQLALITARPEAYCAILRQFKEGPAEKLLEAQHERFGVNEREMMVLMLQDWGMPKLFLDALYHHEDPSASGFDENSRLMRLTQTLKLAALLAQSCMQRQTDGELAAQISLWGNALGIGQEQLETFAQQTAASRDDWGKLLNIQPQHHPPRKPARPASFAPAQSAVAEGTIPQAANPLRITICSTDEAQRSLMEKSLAAAGHTVLPTDNGLTAFGMATQKRPQVIIADWLMPGMDGVKLCADVRKFLPGDPLYFILITPFEDERRKIEAYEAGVDEILHAPVNPRLLAARLLAAKRVFSPFS